MPILSANASSLRAVDIDAAFAERAMPRTLLRVRLLYGPDLLLQALASAGWSCKPLTSNLVRPGKCLSSLRKIRAKKTTFDLP